MDGKRQEGRWIESQKNSTLRWLRPTDHVIRAPQKAGSRRHHGPHHAHKGPRARVSLCVMDVGGAGFSIISFFFMPTVSIVHNQKGNPPCPRNPHVSRSLTDYMPVCNSPSFQLVFWSLFFCVAPRYRHCCNVQNSRAWDVRRTSSASGDIDKYSRTLKTAQDEKKKKGKKAREQSAAE